MSVQVLVATMNQSDHSLIEKMNIQTNAIIGNQCDHNEIEEFQFNNNQILYLNFAEKGVGLNRNNALLRASADYCIFADDDVVYCDGYEQLILNAFTEEPKADVIVFNIEGRDYIRRKHRVWYHNYLRYGTVRIAVKLDSVMFRGICFNQYFGGGAKYCHGEDNLFLTSCLKAGLRIYAVPICIGKLTDDRESTWNVGFDEKYILDQAVLYQAISKNFWPLLCLQDVLRHREDYNMSIINLLKLMLFS